MFADAFEHISSYGTREMGFLLITRNAQASWVLVIFPQMPFSRHQPSKGTHLRKKDEKEESDDDDDDELGFS